MREWLNWLKGGKEKSGTILPSISAVGNLRGRRVLLRAGLNVPIVDGEVGELFRLEAALPTIDLLKKKGAKVIIIAHIGREPEDTLLPVAKILEERAGVKWGGELNGGGRASAQALQDGEALLLENVRRDPRESTGDVTLAKELADLADIYVNDAFADSHREHASIIGVPKYLPSYFGDSFIKEYESLQKVLEPRHPAIFIIGGAKFETKLPLIERFAVTYDHVVVGGALANDLYKAKGYEIGQSLISAVLDLSPLLVNVKIILPETVVVKTSTGMEEKAAAAVGADEKIMDIGLLSLEKLQPLLHSAKTILWNGPLGNYEAGFSSGTEALAKIVASSPAYSVVGGGDTIASIRALGLSDKFGWLSTAGGAMLVFLETGTLPAIEAVLSRP